MNIDWRYQGSSVRFGPDLEFVSDKHNLTFGLFPRLDHSHVFERRNDISSLDPGILNYLCDCQL